MQNRCLRLGIKIPAKTSYRFQKCCIAKNAEGREENVLRETKMTQTVALTRTRTLRAMVTWRSWNKIESWYEGKESKFSKLIYHYI
jgi:hypothetical protein